MGLLKVSPFSSIRSKVVLCRSRSIPQRSEADDSADDDESGNVKSGIRPKRLAVFVSGGGSNFRSIHEACGRGLIHGDIAVLVTNNNKHDLGLDRLWRSEYARDKGLPVVLFPKTKKEPDGISPVDLVAVLRSIVNIHPSLLPAFGGKGNYGMRVHQAVIASGARYTGSTIHFVDEHYDTGHILAQRVVPVLANDTDEQLAARVLKKEHHLYVEVIAALCDERVIWRDDGVPIIRSKENPSKYS